MWCVSARFRDGLFSVTHLLPDIKTMVRVILLEQTVRCVLRSYCFFSLFFFWFFFFGSFFLDLLVLPVLPFGRPNDDIAARDPIKSPMNGLDIAMTDAANNNFILEKFWLFLFFSY